MDYNAEYFAHFKHVFVGSYIASCTKEYLPVFYSLYLSTFVFGFRRVILCTADSKIPREDW